MDRNAELLATQKDAERRRTESAVVQLQPADDYDHMANLFAAAPGEPPPDGSVPMLGTSLAAPRNAGARAMALSRAQRQQGNRFVQRLVSRARRGGAQADAVPSDSAGEPLDTATRAYMEPRYAADFSDVRVHTDSQASASAQAFGARAYTTGRDIYFAAGTYEPATTEGRHLLAHELAHTVQQSGDPGQMSVARSPVRIGAVDDPLEKEAERAADLIAQNANGGAVLTPAGGEPLIQRDPSPAPAQADPAQAQLDDTLSAAGLELSGEDKQQLLANFPTGFILGQEPVFVMAAWSGSVSTARVGAFRVFSAIPMEAGVETYIFRVGKGRAILVSSIGGPSIMLDAGSSVSGSAVAGLNAVLGAGMANAPDVLQISHTDKDHINEVGRVLRASGMNDTDVEIGLQQLRNAVGRADWLRANVRLAPTQSLVEIDVLQADGVHIQRRVMGNMEITEFRLVTPAQVLGTPGQTDSQYRGEKNASSPVTVVQDLTTGETSVFTADGTGHAFSDIVDAVGPEAFRAILGGGGRNLTLAEAPHHGGMEGPGPDARGRIRALRLMFEASKGDVRFFTQTSQSFSSGPSAHIRYLDQVGVGTERVMRQPAGTPGTSVVRAQGNTLEDITVDNQAVQQAVQIVSANVSDIAAGYQRLDDIDQLQQRAQSLQEALSSVPERSRIVASLQQLRTEMDTNRTTLQQATDAYWQALETATDRPGPGIRVGADTAAVNSAAAAIRTVVTQNPLKPYQDSIDAHEQLATIEILLIQNALEMNQALAESRIQDLENLKAAQGELMRQAAAALGAGEVKDQVRAAWEATEAIWTPRVMSNIGDRLGTTVRAEQRMETAFNITLSTGLAEQLRSNQVAQNSGLGTFVDVPLRGRIGPGIMLAVQLGELGFDLYSQYKADKAAKEMEAENRKIRGQNLVRWWLARGVVPEVALVDDDGRQVASYMAQKTIYQIVANTYVGTPPDFDRIVVVGVPVEERLRAVAQLAQQAFNLDDWFRLVQDERYDREDRGHTPFLKQDDQWNTLLFDLDEHKYTVSFDQTVHDRLEALYTRLRANQDAGLAVEQALHPENKVQTLEDTGWIRTLRYAWVYRENGHLDRIDFGHTKPKFWLGWLPSDSSVNLPRDMRMVQAADITTYERLRQYWWPISETETEGGGYGPVTIGSSLSLSANNNGYALVRPGDLEDVEPRLEDGASANGPLTTALPDGNGDALDPATLGLMESRFAADFSGVRIHADSGAGETARAIQAQAFTAGRDIYFAPGKYSPATVDGRHLLAHELAHTIQQCGRAPDSADAVVTGNAGRREQEAERAAESSEPPLGHNAGNQPDKRPNASY